MGENVRLPEDIWLHPTRLFLRVKNTWTLWVNSAKEYTSVHSYLYEPKLVFLSYRVNTNSMF